MEKPNDQQIEEYLAQVEASGALGKSERRKKLLRHLILAEAEGDGGQLKAYSIGLDIFGKSEDFDPQSDSVVRVEVGRLRTAIALFEASDFAVCALKVEIPKGTYRPTFSFRDVAGPADSATGSVATNEQYGKIWLIPAAAVALSIIAMAFWFIWSDRGEGGDSRIVVQINDLFGERGAEAASILRQGLLANKAVSVLLEPNDGGIDPMAEFLLSGSTTSGQTNTGVSIELINARTNKLAWSRTVELDNENFRQGLIDHVSRELRVRLFGVTKELLEGRDPENLTPEQLFIMGTWVPGPAVNAVSWELERVELMEVALRKNPEFGAAHSVVADKLAYLANVYGPSDTPELLDKAKFHAQRAMELAPLDANVVFNVAQSQWHSGQISASHATMRRVTELDANHTIAQFLSDVIPYTCATAPQTAVDAATAFDDSLSADNPIRWLTLTWVAWLHAYRGEYDRALAAEEHAALIFEIPYTFMRHAMLLNKLGRTDEAAELLERQKANWPDIDTAHFASVTIPRLCSEADNAGAFIGLYEELDAALSR